MTKNNGPIIASAYAVVPKEDDLEAVPVTVSVELDRPAHHTVSPEYYQSIQEARGLSWTDDFFCDEDDIVAVFDFDYDIMESYYATIGWGCLASTLFCPSVLLCALFGGVPCALNTNINRNVRAQHLAVTRDGILFVHDKHPSSLGLCSWDVSKRTKLVRSKSMSRFHIDTFTKFSLSPSSLLGRSPLI
jgi:hypothetical protein